MRGDSSARVHVPSHHMSSSASPVRTTLSALGLAGIAAGITMVFLGMRDVMEIGGVCGSGNTSLRLVRECPDGLGTVFFGGAVLALVGAGMHVVCAPRGGPRPILLVWPALFISLGWNFVSYALDPPDGGGTVTGWLIPGIVFFIMGGVPLLALLASRTLRERLIGSSTPRPGMFTGTAGMGGLGGALSMLDAANRAASAATSAPAPSPAPAPQPAAAPAPAPAPAPADDMVASLERLAELHRAGALDEAEYRAAKDRVLDGGAG